MERDVISPVRLREDSELDNKLRPRSLADDEFIGQERIKEQLAIFMAAAKERGEPLDHVLIWGPPGLGKTTLAYIIAREMGAQITATSGPAVGQPKDLAAMLTHLGPGDVLFLDEVHRLSPAVEELLYPAMEDFSLDIMLGKGPSARTVKLEMAPFTLIGATTRAGLLTSPLRARFGVVIRVGFYSQEEMRRVVLRSARILNVEITEDGAQEIAKRSRGTPRVANRLLKRVRDYAQVKGDGRVTREVADAALTLLEVDEYGLDEMDKRILKTIVEKFSGGPVGLNSLAVAVGEEPDTIEEVYEPYLIQEGFLERTPQGRRATLRALRYLGLDPGPRQGELL